jgi:hypothetical protein
MQVACCCRYLLELGLEFEVVKMDIHNKKDNLEPEYLKVCPRQTFIMCMHCLKHGMSVVYSMLYMQGQFA